MDLFLKYWRNFKQRPDIWFFYAFLLTSTLSVRKVLFFYPIGGAFNEYAGAYIYLSDIFLLLTIITWLFLLYNNYSILSILKNLRLNCSTWNNLSLKEIYQHVINSYLVIFPVFLVLFSFLSVLWSINKPIAVFRSIKVAELILMYFYVLQIVPRGTIAKPVDRTKCSTWNNPKEKVAGLFSYDFFPKNFLKNTFLIIILIGFIQAIIGLYGFFKQSSVGLFWLKESIVSVGTPGVAKIIFNGQTYVRAYGLFPHPNIFGGFLVFSILITLLYFKMFHVEHSGNKDDLNSSASKKLFHVEQFVQPSDENCSTWNNFKNKVSALFPHKTRAIYLFLLLIQGAALSSSFSKSAILGLLMGLFYISVESRLKNVPRGTFSEKLRELIKMFHVEHFERKLILTIGTVILFFVVIKSDIYFLLFKSLQEREFYLNVSRGTFLAHPLLGVGSGQFIFSMASHYMAAAWQYQPVHNVFLLILNEFGIFVLLLFVYFLYKLFHVEHFEPTGDKNCSTWNNLNGEVSYPHIGAYLRAVIIAFTFVMLFDHYLWDIQPGMIIFWLAASFASTKAKS